MYSAKFHQKLPLYEAQEHLYDAFKLLTMGEIKPLKSHYSEFYDYISSLSPAITVSVSAAQETKLKKLKAERDKAVARISQLEDFIVSIGQDIPQETCSSPA